MNLEKAKFYFYVAGALFFTASIVILLIFANAYASHKTFLTTRSFQVEGEGKVSAIPDVAIFSFGVVDEGDKNLTFLVDKNTKKTNAVINFLKTNGVAVEDIKTLSYNIAPRYKYYTCNAQFSNYCLPPEIVGYTVSHVVEVKVKDLKKIGVLLEGVIQNGANNISSLTFSIDDRDSLELEAKTLAIKKAKEMAGQMAKAAGFSLGKIISLSYHTSSYRNPIIFNQSFKMGSEENAVNVEAGKEEISAVVTLTYEIK